MSLYHEGVRSGFHQTLTEVRCCDDAFKYASNDQSQKVAEFGLAFKVLVQPLDLGHSRLLMLKILRKLYSSRNRYNYPLNGAVFYDNLLLTKDSGDECSLDTQNNCHIFVSESEDEYAA